MATLTISTLIRTDSLDLLNHLLALLPNGATCNVLTSDLEAGNFETAHFEIEDETRSLATFDLVYSGPVREGYISPLVSQSQESDLHE